MKFIPISAGLLLYPDELRPFLSGAKLFDSSCSADATVVFIDKDGGYFLKCAPKGGLERENAMTRYFYGKGLSAEVIAYISDKHDWLLTAKIPGDDCISSKYLEQPEKLVDILAERLFILHNTGFRDCPVQNHTESYLKTAELNYNNGNYNVSLFPDNWGYTSADEAYGVIKSKARLLKSDTLLHGDYCLPNIVLNNWKFSGFIDVGRGGVGDRHVDLFWALWTLVFNFKTDKYRDRFIDAYGRKYVNEDYLRIVAAVEVFL